MKFGVGLALLGAAMSCVVSGAQDNKDAVAGGLANGVSSTSAQKTPLTDDRKVPLLTRPVTLADFAGMKASATVEAQMAKIENFTQTSPSDGAAPTERTEAYIGRTNSALYVVFLCFDKHPGQIRGHLARRENILNDDTVSVLLDPFQDRRRGTLFQVNPVGVQADAAFTDGNGSDYSYDQVWDSEGHVTAQGWMALIAIPFRSLRFRPSGGDWGVVLERNLPRNSENDFWPRISQSVSGRLSQEGTLHGIAGVTGSHNVQFTPYAITQNEKTLNSTNPVNPYFSDRHLEGTAGGDAKLIVKDSIVIDATVNPDFSQIESDQPQFTVNQRYPVYFPELRPFFLENANYFGTPINLVYTRNIVNPEFGVRVTGKVGQTNIGVFAIDDREPGMEVGVDDPLYKKRSTYAVGRVSQDIGKRGSNVGLIYTDEEFGSGWNRVGGLDFTARLDDHWTLTGQAVESSSKASNPKSASSLLDPGTASGYAAGPSTYFEQNRSGHAFNLDNTYADFSNGFRTDVGFLTTPNLRSDSTNASYHWYPQKSFVQIYGIEASQQFAFDHQGRRVYHYGNTDFFMTFPRGFVLAPLIGQNSDTLGPQEGYNLTANRNFTENQGGMIFRGAPSALFNFALQAFRGGNVNYSPANGVPSLLNQQTVNFKLSVQPLRQLTADNVYLLDRDFDAHNGQFVYESQTFRTKINYQFTRAFSARVIVEYDSTLANASQTSLSRTKQVGTEALLTWLPHPGTAIYLGYNNDIQNYDRTLCSRVATGVGAGACDVTQPILGRSSNYLNDGKQIFLKVSYLLRL